MSDAHAASLPLGQRVRAKTNLMFWEVVGGMGVATGCCMHYTVYEIILLLICINSYDFL